MSLDLDTETSTFSSLLALALHTWFQYFTKDICYLIVDDDASNARLLYDFLRNCSGCKFATSHCILFGSCVEEVVEKLINTTANNGLRITIEANKQIINFLDVTFNLNQSTYPPFTKPNTSLRYVHRESNHPPITIKNILAGINKRLSSLSSNKASFDQAALPYQKAVEESRYHYTLQYEPAKTSKRKNGQRNNILWYNPPFSKNTSMQHRHRTQIPRLSRQALSQISKAQKNIQPKKKPSRSVTAARTTRNK